MFNKHFWIISFIFSVTSCSISSPSLQTDSEELVKSSSLTSLYSYKLIDSSSRLPIDVSTLANNLKNTDVVFIGEFHSHQALHLLQLQLIEALYQQDPNIVISMEQFTRDSQVVLDKYLNGEYGESTLIDEGKAWPHYKGSYRAIIEFAREHDISVIAANSPAMHVRCVGKNGADFIKKFPVEQANWSAKELDLENESYKDKFMSFIKQSGRSHGQTPAEQKARQMKTYAAQLLRDTTMAESIIIAMKAEPKAKIVHLNGSFHSDNHLDTVAVLEAMKPNVSTSVLSPITVENTKSPTAKENEYAQGDYIYLLRDLPNRFKNDDKRNASIRKLIKNRMTETCDL